MYVLLVGQMHGKWPVASCYFWLLDMSNVGQPCLVIAKISFWSHICTPLLYAFMKRVGQCIYVGCSSIKIHTLRSHVYTYAYNTCLTSGGPMEVLRFLEAFNDLRNSQYISFLKRPTPTHRFKKTHASLAILRIQALTVTVSPLAYL